MFRTVIRENSLYNQTANDFFTNIYGDTIYNDTSFITTLRALVAPRMENEDYINVQYSDSCYSKVSFNGVSPDDIIRIVCRYFPVNSKGSIWINALMSNSEVNQLIYSTIEQSFESVFKGWHRINKITDFFRKQFGVLCFINPDTKSVALFVDKFNTQLMHYLQCSILAFLPWYFNPKDGVTEDEMNLIKSLREKDANNYLQCIEKISKKYKFREEKIKKLLKGFETKIEAQECERTKDRISQIIASINRTGEQLKRLLSDKNEAEIRLLGLETKISQNEEDSEVMEYFLCNENLSLSTVSGSTMTFVAKGYLSYFDEDILQSMLDNPNSYLYRYIGNNRGGIDSLESMKKLIKAIFIDQTLRIRMCAAYQFDIQGRIYGLSGYVYDASYKDYLPNPHIDRYSCMGNYERTIFELLKNRNYIGAIEQCIASCISLNFADSVVMDEFIKDLCGIGMRNGSFVELPDGTNVTPADAVKWLEKQEKGEESNEQNN